jgi:hypothetical protein
MSLNFGNDAFDAARQLREQEPWRVIRASLLEATRKAMNTALETPAPNTSDAVGYARALRDVYTAFEAATTGQPMNRTDKPGPIGKPHATAR